MAGCARRQPAQPGSAQSLQGANLATIKFWGSCLYVFSDEGRTVEVVFLRSAAVPDCAAPAHDPRVDLSRARVGGSSQIRIDTALPPGVFTVDPESLASTAPLQAVGYNDPSRENCPASAADLESLAHVPLLQASGSTFNRAALAANALTILRFTNGRMTGAEPRDGGYRAATIWELRGPTGAAPQRIVVTDTVSLQLPLRGNQLVLVRESDRQRLVFEASNGTFEVVMEANPSDPGHAANLQPGERAPHYCLLYGAFDPPPALTNRRELHYVGPCVPAAAAPGPHGMFSPGKFCTGAKVIV
jgi:hypothetical protein